MPLQLHMRRSLSVLIVFLSTLTVSLLSQAPQLNSISPTLVSPGMQVTLTGTGFGASQGGGLVSFGSGAYGTVVNWGDTQIVATVPSTNLTPGNISVRQNGLWSNGVAFSVIPPVLNSIAPTLVSPGMQVTLTGTGFGASQGDGLVRMFNAYATIVSWTDTQIVATVPAENLAPGNMTVRKNGVWSNGIAFTVVPPVLNSIAPTLVSPGMQVTLTGTGFGASQGDGLVRMGNAYATIVSWSDTQIVATVPPDNLAPSTMGVRKNGVWSNGITFTVIPPVLSSIAPTLVSPGMQVTLTGTGFGASQGDGLVRMGNAYATIVSWSDTQIVATVPPDNLAPSSMTVRKNGVWSNGIAFTVVPPVLNSIAPTLVSPGMQVTLTGTGFGASQGDGLVRMANPYATIVSWSDTRIVATVPSTNLTPGNMTVRKNGVWSNGKPFTIVPTPSISSIMPTQGAVGSSVTISGISFGDAQAGNSGVVFNDTAAIPTSWSNSSIVVPVPAGATTGNVVVTVSGLATNGLPFTVIPTPNITSLSPTSGAVGTAVTIRGNNFGTTGTVSFNGTTATPTNWGNTSITVPVPAGATSGNVVVTAGGVASAGIPFTVVTANPINTSRYQHSATLLNNGKILIAGGVTCPSPNSCTYLSSAELYDPATGTSTNTGSMATARSAPAVLLPNGKVLIAGGATCDYGNCGSQNTAEIYDPTAGTFSSAGNLQYARDGQTMTLLADGRVLIAGGEFCSTGGSEMRGEPLFGEARLVYASFSPAIISTSCNVLQTVEIFDPASGVFSSVEPMHTARYNAAAVRLTDGRVLIVGGSDEFNPLYSAEIYDPSTSTFSELPNGLGLSRTSPAATQLNNGSVLISGGSTSESPLAPTNSAELFDPSTGAFRFTAVSMHAQRAGHTATLLTNGQVLLTGGMTACSQSCTSSSSTELYDSASDTFTTSQALGSARAVHTGTVGLDGKAYLIGGIANGTTLASVEPYTPATLAPPNVVSIAVTPANPSVLVGETRQMTAVGTFSDGSTQTLQSVLWSSSNTNVISIANAIGSNGIISPKSVGSSTITATVGNVTGSTVVTVPTLVSLSLYPQNTVITAAESQQVIARATFDDGSIHDQTSAATWSMSDTSVAIVGNDSGRKGLVYGLTPANATITAAIGSVSATGNVQVLPLPSVPPAPFISGMSPVSGGPGTAVTITGSGFGSVQAGGIIWLGNTYGNVVSWSDTQVVATVASGASSGNVQIEQSGIWSNSYDFVVNAPTISDISPASGLPGTQVTINGSGFGSAPGSAWLGTASGAIVSWSDTQVVATVSPGSTSGAVQILQNGVLSNALTFTVNIPHIDDVSPSAGSPGTTVTITGTGFGTTQGAGNVQLGSTTGVVSSWNDTQIVALVAADAQNGIARVTQNGIASNFKNFSVPPSGTSTNVHITPDIMTMLVGETRTLQALDGNGMELHSLNWAVTDSSIASLSTDDPPVLTALSPGHVTITAGDGSADLTVSPDPVLPVGTIIWSVPGDGSGVAGIGPAVPSSEGVADVFAYNNSGRVQAITADGEVKWTVDVSAANNTLADFQGGLVAQDSSTIKKFDGITGAAYPAYTFSKAPNRIAALAVHTDGTIFTLDGTSLVGIDPKTGEPKFTVSIDERSSYSIQGAPWRSRATRETPPYIGKLIIAGDGYAYIPYEYWTYNNSYPTSEWDTYEEHDKVYLKVLRVGSGGDSQKITVKEWSYDATANHFLAIDGIDPYLYEYPCREICNSGSCWNECEICRHQDGCPRGHWVTTNHQAGVAGIALAPYAEVPPESAENEPPGSPLIPFGDLITNADQGAVLPVGPFADGFSSSYIDPPGTTSLTPADFNSYLATISGGNASLAKLNMPDGTTIQPVLQREDGSYIGTAGVYWGGNRRMVGVNTGGNQLFSVEGDYQPQVATKDGGFIALSASGVTAMFDASGNATDPLTGQVATTIQSWRGNSYQYGSTDNVVRPAIALATAFMSWPWGGSDTAKLQSEFPLLPTCTNKTLNPPVPCPGPGDLIWNAKQDLARQLTTDPNCVQAAQNNIFDKLNNNGGDWNRKPIYTNHFVGYLQDNPHFYNGPIAKALYTYALCGHPAHLRCTGNILTVAEAWETDTTALTVSPSYPFESFWQPTYTPPLPSDKTAYGFGVGIDPGNYGANIYTESDLFHETLHGITGKYDDDIAAALNATSGKSSSDSISIYIMQNVLSQCSSFAKK